MIIDMLAGHIAQVAAYAHVWGFLIVFVLMAIESSFLPLPSEVVMIPAGFMAYRCELTFSSPAADMTAIVFFGMTGSIAGAYVNYYLSLMLGRPVLYRYGKYFFLSPKTLARAEEVFNEYGEIATFVCRLLPALRHLISIPAGLSRMPHKPFITYTALGAGIWCAILAGIGYYLASLFGNMTYAELVRRGVEFLHKHRVWIFLGLTVTVAVYIAVHHHVMKSRKKPLIPVEG
jgi:membrane protein DedA with SNARE-associated domain